MATGHGADVPATLIPQADLGPAVIALGVGVLVVVILVGVAIGVGVFVLGRRRTRNTDRSTGWVPKTAAAASAPLAQLRQQAGQALVQADDAVKAAEEDVAFTVAAFGDAAVAEYRAAIDTATNRLREAFRLQQLLDDAVPEPETTQRQWIDRILSDTAAVRDMLAAQRAEFDSLRAQQQSAPQVIEQTANAVAAATAALPEATAQLAALQKTYAAPALAAVASNTQQAEDRLAFARQNLDAAHADAAAFRLDEALRRAHAAADASDQAMQLTAAIAALQRDLAAADAALQAGITDIEADIAGARTSGGDLAGLAERTSTELAAIRSAAAGDGRDPFTLVKRLRAVGAAIEDGLATARGTVVQRTRAIADRDRALASARAHIGATEQYLATRRGAIGQDARTRLTEAQRFLQLAEQAINPVEGAEHADRADLLANEALQHAQHDVGEFRPNVGGGDILSAVLGGFVVPDDPHPADAMPQRLPIPNQPRRKDTSW